MRIVVDLQGLQTPSSAHRGVGRYTKNLVQELLRLKSPHDFILALNGAFTDSILEIRSAFAGLIDPENIRVWEQTFDTAYNSASKSAVAAGEILREHFLQSLCPDIIFCPNLQEGWSDPASTSVVYGNHSTLYYTTLHDVVPLFYPEYIGGAEIRRWYYSKLTHARRSDIIITVSESAKKDISEKLNLEDHQIVVVENGYDEELFSPRPPTDEERARLTKAHKLPQSFLLYCGGADKHKNLERLVEAYARIDPALRRSTKLALVGREIVSNEALNATILDLGLSKDVLRFGFVEDELLPTLIKSSIAFVFPSTHEGFGLPALEAMACGAPVVGARTSSVGELIANPAATFDPFDVRDMAASLERVLTDPAFRGRIAQAGLERAKSYSWKSAAEKLLRVFESNGPRGSRQITPPETLLTNVVHAMEDVAPSLSEHLLAEIAESIASTFPQQRRKTLFIDISAVIRLDYRSGIQRVTRAISSELIKAPPPGLDVRIVSTSSDDLNFYVASDYMRENFGIWTDTQDELLEFQSGDILLYLDLHPQVAIAHKHWNLRLRAKGVRVHHVVYDIIPILRPETFWPELCNEFREWAETVSLSDGAICISRAVADELATYLTIFGERRPDPFKIGWFHLGADITNSKPTTGLPDDASQMLAAMISRPSFLMVGTLEPRKGHRQVLSAFEQLWRSGIDCTLVIVGRLGWMMDSFSEQLRTSPEFSKRLIWISGASDEYLDLIYQASIALIAASEAEGFGLPLIEAARHGVPMIIRDIPVFREVAGEHAYYFADNLAPESVADAVTSWLELKARGRQPSPSGLASLTWRESAEQLVDVITRQHWLHEVRSSTALRPYSRQDHRSRRLTWTGFGIPDDDKRPVLGARAQIGFQWVGPTEPAQLRLRCTAGEQQVLEISLNGVVFYSKQIEAGEHLIICNLPPIFDGSNTLSFSGPAMHAGDEGATGRLSIAVHELEIAAGLAPLALATNHAHSSHDMEWRGFSGVEENFRWSNGHTCHVTFVWAGGRHPVEVAIAAFALGDQRVEMKLNNELVFSGKATPNLDRMVISAESLQSGYNTITILLPDARPPGGKDERLLGLAIHNIRVDEKAA